MKKETLIAIGFSALLMSCNAPKQEKVDVSPEKEITGLVQEVLTKEQQDALTADAVITSFKEGNERFINNDLTARDHSAQVRNSTMSQYPKAIVLSCVDSRVPVEDVFDRGIGDIFVARVAGNFVNEDILGSMEFACKLAGTKVVVVLGHTACGAVKGACDDAKLGNLTALLSKIKPAVAAVTEPTDANLRNSSNIDFVNTVAEKNVHLTIDNIRTQSPVLKEMEDEGTIKIVGAMYDIKDGSVTFY